MTNISRIKEKRITIAQIKYSGNLTREKIFLFSFKSSCTKKRNKDEACFKQSESQFKKNFIENLGNDPKGTGGRKALDCFSGQRSSEKNREQ